MRWCCSSRCPLNAGSNSDARPRARGRPAWHSEPSTAATSTFVDLPRRGPPVGHRCKEWAQGEWNGETLSHPRSARPFRACIGGSTFCSLVCCSQSSSQSNLTAVWVERQACVVVRR
jgi:hypothetical protein